MGPKQDDYPPEDSTAEIVSSSLYNAPAISSYSGGVSSILNSSYGPSSDECAKAAPKGGILHSTSENDSSDNGSLDGHEGLDIPVETAPWRFSSVGVVHSPPSRKQATKDTLKKFYSSGNAVALHSGPVETNDTTANESTDGSYGKQRSRDRGSRHSDKQKRSNMGARLQNTKIVLPWSIQSKNGAEVCEERVVRCRDSANSMYVSSLESRDNSTKINRKNGNKEASAEPQNKTQEYGTLGAVSPESRLTGGRLSKEGCELKRKNKHANRAVSSLIAMLQGVEVLCSLSIMYLYKDDFKMDPALMTIVLSALRLPWTVKPVWAILSDCVPIFGSKRKSYIFLGSSLCLISTLGMGTVGHNYMWSTTFLLFLYFLGSAICNVIGEALVVEEGRDSTSENGAARTVSIFFAFRKFSFAIMSYLSGFLLTYMEKQHVFLVATILPTAVFVSALFVSEAKGTITPISTQLTKLYETVKQPILQNSTLFIFLMMCTPSAGSVMFYFMTNALEFGPELLGRMALFQAAASMAGILTYMWWFSSTSIRSLLLWSSLIITPFCLLPVVVVQRWNLVIGIPDSAFVVTDTVLMEFIGEFQAMPILILAAKLCPPGLESTIYSFLLSAYNIGLAIGSIFSAGLTAVLGITSTNFDNLSIMVVICALTNFLPLCVLFLVPNNTESMEHVILEESSRSLITREKDTEYTGGGDMHNTTYCASSSLSRAASTQSFNHSNGHSSNTPVAKFVSRSHPNDGINT